MQLTTVAVALRAPLLLCPAIGTHWTAPTPTGGRGPSVVGTILVCLAVLPLVYRRRAPALVLALLLAPDTGRQFIYFDF